MRCCGLCMGGWEGGRKTYRYGLGEVGEEGSEGSTCPCSSEGVDGLVVVSCTQDGELPLLFSSCWVGGWVGYGKVEENEAVRMRCCGLGEGGWVGDLTTFFFLFFCGWSSTEG